MQNETILVVNPGSTSTKTALYAGPDLRASGVLRHPAEELARFARIPEQYSYRLDALRRWCAEHPGVPAAVISLGGLLHPVAGGTYRVNALMLRDAGEGARGEHASNLGCLLAAEMAAAHGCPAFVADPVSVDEFEPLARYSGHPLIERRSFSHALNIHAVARRAAETLGVPHGESRFVIAHLGGGISVAPVAGGRIIDVNDAASGGPFSPERTGTLPLQQFITLCFSGRYGEKEMRALVMGNGGLVAYLGTNNAAEVERRIGGGDARAREVYEAMAYQIAKEIGAMAVVLEGRIHAVVLTGGLASSALLVDRIRERIAFLGPFLLFPGEDELGALAAAALRVLRGEEQPLEYS